MKTIVIKEILSDDIRLRTNAEVVINAINDDTDTQTLDFKDVKFISRSFADELYSFIKKYPKINLINMSSVVQSIMDAVRNTHKYGKKETKEKIVMGKITSEKDLRAFLSTF